MVTLYSLNTKLKRRIGLDWEGLEKQIIKEGVLFTTYNYAHLSVSEEERDDRPLTLYALYF